MPVSIWETIAETPWWFYVLLLYFLYISFLATKPRVVSLKQLIIFPAIFVSISMVGMIAMKITFLEISIWIGTLLLGGLLGWLQFLVSKIKAIKNESKFYFPGTWSLFIIIFGLLALKYDYHYPLMMTPEMLVQPKYVALLFAIYGLITGLFIGRIAYCLRCLKVGPYYDSIERVTK